MIMIGFIHSRYLYNSLYMYNIQVYRAYLMKWKNILDCCLIVCNFGIPCVYQHCTNCVSIITFGRFSQSSGFYEIFFWSQYTWWYTNRYVVYERKRHNLLYQRKSKTYNFYYRVLFFKHNKNHNSKFDFKSIKVNKIFYFL